MTDAEFVAAVRRRISGWPKSWEAYWDIRGILDTYDQSTTDEQT